jgi:hypothetical protein
MRRKRLVAVSTLAVAGMLSAGTASAGFFDALFGTSEVQQAPAPPPSEITVGPSRSMSTHRVFTRPRTVVRKTPVRTKLASRPSTPTPVNLDPNEDPDWFLHDPTLRAGDVVVLDREVLVFSKPSKGGKHSREDFVSLKKSSLVSAETRDLIERIASTSATSDGSEQNSAKPKDVASLSTGKP